MAISLENSQYSEQSTYDREFWVDVYVRATKSSASQYTRRSKTTMLLKWLENNAGVIHPLDATPQNLLSYFLWVENESGYTQSTKDQRYRMCAAFFKHIKAYLKLYGVEYTNPTPKRWQVGKFTPKESEILREQLEERTGVIPIKVLVQILKEARLYGSRWMAIFTIAVVTGARPGEVLSIHKDDLDLTLGYFYTGKVDGAMKSNQNGGRPIVHCLTDWAIPIVRSYLRIREGKRVNATQAKFLFPANTRKGWSDTQRFAEKCREISERIGFKFTPKNFRTTIVSLRDDMGCPAKISDYLQWHQQKDDTQGKYYKKSNLLKRLARYYEWNPYKLEDFAEC